MNRQDEPHRGPWLARSMFPRSSGSKWPLLFALAVGVAAGLGAYTFSYAKGLSYFGTEPEACINCHIMEPQYAGWQKGSHHNVAVCIDCHLPASFIPKYLAKAENGYRHGKLFTTQTFEEPITVKRAGLEILQSNCERCHAALVHGMLVHEMPVHEMSRAGAQGVEKARGPVSGPMSCLHCHWTVGHGERAGLGGPQRANENVDVRTLKTDVTHE